MFLSLLANQILFCSSELTNKSKEILFEVWNENEEKELFLGLGIVSTEELQLSQSQRMVIPLQGNPAFKPAGSLEEDMFGGLLTLQFLLTNMDSTQKAEETIHDTNIVEDTLLDPIHPSKVSTNFATQCGNFRIFLSFRFYVKSTLVENLDVLIMGQSICFDI